MRPSSGKESVVLIHIHDPSFSVAIAQGVLPQVLTLLGNLGGYLSLMSALFFAVWVRRHPHSEVANTFEERTLIGFAENGQDGEQGLRANADTHSPGVSELPRSCLGVSQDLGQMPEYPERPPGIVLPTGYRASE